MREIKFHTYNGLAGDEHELLVGVDQDGRREDELFNRCFFPIWSLRRAKKKIMKRFEIMTGQEVRKA